MHASCSELKRKMCIENRNFIYALRVNYSKYVENLTEDPS